MSSTQALPCVSRTRAYTLLFLFSTAQLLDIVNVTAPVIALPQLTLDLDLVVSETQWVLNAYTLTFGAFLLTGGRFNAVYGPKALFISGLMIVGLGSVINGFTISGPMLFVIRALQGIGAALTVPSAITMIVLLFPNRVEQDRFGAVGNMGGLVIGGIISERIGWRWCFWVMALTILPICVATFFLSPSPASTRSRSDVYKNMDWIGLFLMTASVLLLVFAVTEGNIKGWTSKEVLPPLIISVIFLPAFYYVERIVKEPLIPPWIWTLPTFFPLFFIVLSQYAYMNTIVLQMSEVFQRVWKVSAINAAIRIVPFGLTGLITTFIAGTLTPYVSPRFLLSGGHALVSAGAALLAFSGTKNTYWPKVFPAFLLSCGGLAMAFVSSNIAMLRAPLFKPGVNLLESTSLIGAIFNASLQIGSSIGLAIVIAITTKAGGGDPNDFNGYRAGWWFIVGLAGFEALLAAFSLWRHRIPSEHIDDQKSMDASQDTASERRSA
ncbi:hypothetical protein C0995_001479 [Termitomyces sp. Mi166|nr:hypothetical protein C0995_001479 [Termitomyces sp. Mi166\